MARLQLDFEWEAPGAARGPELRATWARLRIAIGGEVVTQVADQAGESVRDAVYVPLYPLAEWIVSNWWALLFEPASPSRMTSNGFARRHNLAAAAEGFALPRLQIRPEGQRVLVAWNSVSLPDARVRFLAQGSAYVAQDELEADLRTFVSAVANRLDDQGLPDTPLAEDWKAVCSIDAEEREFCRVAGLLGWDPYAMEARETEAVITVASQFRPGLLNEFLAVANRERLGEDSNDLAAALQRAQRTRGQLKPITKLREHPIQVKPGRAPWEQGYELARQLRSRLGVNGAHVESVEQLGRMLKVEPTAWRRATAAQPATLGFANAMVAVNQVGSPHFVVENRNPAARTFALCRALCAYLAEPQEPAALVTTAYTERQKRNRAFAAELIAPAAQLRDAITVPLIPAEEVQALATSLGTSEYVVRHQIENHHIARVADHEGLPGA